MRWLPAFLMLLPLGCALAPVDEEHRVLAEDTLVPRPGHHGLTSTVCKYDKNHNCVEDVKEYLLEDPAVRKQLLDLKFVCSMGNGRLYMPAEHSASLIWQRLEPSCVWILCGPDKVVEQDLVPLSDYQRLIDAHTVCWSAAKYGTDDRF